MGLDMYLYLKQEEYKGIYISEPDDTDLTLDYPAGMEKIEETMKKMGDSKSVTRDTLYKVGYWRKANAIHQWFVDNCAGGEDDCRPVHCELEALETLLANCKLVKRVPQMAEEVLPTQGGFFFGNTEYDDYYYQNIDDTIEILENVIEFIKNAVANKDYRWSVVYEASW